MRTCASGENFDFAQWQAALDADHLHENELADENFSTLEKFCFGITYCGVHNKLRWILSLESWKEKTLLIIVTNEWEENNSYQLSQGTKRKEGCVEEQYCYPLWSPGHVVCNLLFKWM